LHGEGFESWHFHLAIPAVVCVKPTKFRDNHCPALITVKELLEDMDFREFNATHLPPKIRTVADAAGIEPGQTRSIPALFFKKGNSENPPAVAFTPNPANLQWVETGNECDIQTEEP
jgi:hypothetical protein